VGFTRGGGEAGGGGFYELNWGMRDRNGVMKLCGFC
jgi:hypothetical protein